MKGNGRMIKDMVKEQKLSLMGKSMLGNGKEISMLENTWMGESGTEQFTTKTETSQKSM